MKTETLLEQKETANAGSLPRLVRRMEIAIRWQYRRKVFLSSVIKAIGGDVKMAMLGLLAGLCAPFVLVLTIPCRLGIWMLSPIFTPFVRMDAKMWLMMADIIERKNPPNAPHEPCGAKT